MIQNVCPQCGYSITKEGAIRCLRCNKLLLVSCNGNCSACQGSAKCKSNQ